jgi:hypothetical protein
MDMSIHAQMMANLCTPPFAQLILQVPTRHADTGDVQRQLIGAIAHGDQMARICQSRESQEMIYTVTEQLFTTAVASHFDIQGEAARFIVGMVSHADAMARIATEGAEEVFAAVRPIAHDPVPGNSHELERLRQRLEKARQEIGNISHRVMMERPAV